MDILKVGDRFSSVNFGIFTVKNYTNAHDVLIEFDNTGYCYSVAAGNARRGLVKDNMAKTVYGVGCLGNGKYKSRLPNNGPCTKEYSTWSSMMHRCYGEERDETTLRNYIDCLVCEDWHNFQNFAKWCNSQPEMLYKNSSLDKDILVKGNRVYSPNACCFVPSQLNTAVTGTKHQNSTGKAGVWKFKDSYISEVTIFSAKSGLGSFDNIDDAQFVYNKVKEAYIRALAEIYKSDINQKAYTILKGWTV